MKSDYRGKLMPGAKEALQRELEELKEAHREDVLKGVEILAPDPSNGCPVAEKLKGYVFSIERVPSLPLPGCTRSPCCACCYVGVTKK